MTTIWPPGCPKKSQNLQFVLNKWQYQISHNKLPLFANLQLLGGCIFSEVGNWPFLTPILPLESPKRVKKRGLTKIDATVEILASSYHFIGNSAPLLIPFWLAGARKGYFNGKSLSVSSDYEKQSLSLTKTPEKLTSPKLSKRFWF